MMQRYMREGLLGWPEADPNSHSDRAAARLQAERWTRELQGCKVLPNVHRGVLSPALAAS